MKLVFVAVVAMMTGCAMSADYDASPELALPALSGVAEGLSVHVLEAAVERWNNDVGAVVFWEDAHDNDVWVSVIVSVAGDPGVYLGEREGVVCCEVVLASDDAEALRRGLGECLGVDGDVNDAEREMLLNRLGAE